MIRRVLIAFFLAAATLVVPASAQLFRRPAVRVADVAPAPIDLQAVVDAAAAVGRQEVRLPAGVYRLSRPLVLRPSNVYGTIRLIGAGPRYNGDARFGGTELIADHDGPAVVIQGGRGSGVERLSIRGPLWGVLFDRPFPGADLAAWPGERRRYNPSAGIAVDLGAPYSEHPRILDCEIGGFEVGVVTKPDGGDGNGDFLTLRQCRILHCVYAISVTHTQSRRVTVEDCTIQDCHTGVTNRDHGKGLGEVDGWIRADFNQVARLCHFTQGYAGPTVFQSCYGELIGTLGNFESGGSRAATRTIFRDCRIDLRTTPGQNDLIADGGFLLLDGGIYSTNDLPVCGSAVECRGVKFRPAYYEMLGPFLTGRKLAANRFPLIDRPHPAKTGTGIGDVKSVAYFPNPESSDYQVSRETPPGLREYRVWEKRFCKYDADLESLTLPVGSKPDRGDVIQCDVTMTAWAVVQVAADGRTCAMERVNHRGRTIPTGGHWYLVKGQ